VEAVTLIEFLRARYDEDEQVASMAAGPIGHRWQPNPAGGLSGRDGPMRVHLEDRQCLPHIARHDPARVLADVAAKRAIIADCTEMLKMCQVDRGGNLGRPGEHMMGDFGRWILQKIAAPYADHPDFDPAWQPAQVTT
jgi:hypothetical protein